MEQKLTSYRVYLASSRALLDLDADVGSLHGDRIIVTDDEESENTEDVRYNLVQTLLRREKLYQECLRSIFDVYAEPLRKFSSLSPEDHRILFFSLEPILSFSTTLCLKLNDAIQTWDPGTTRIGNLFSKQFWHHYDEYYFRYPNIRRLLKHKQETDEEFRQFCRIRHGASHHTLESLLLLPVQRISDYYTFLSRLLSTTESSHPDYEDLKKAFDKVQMMMKDREKQVQNVENEQKMDTVQDRFPNDDLHLQEKEKKNKNPGKRRATAGAVLLKSLGKKHHQSDKTALSSGATMPSGGEFIDSPTSLLTCDNSTNRVYVLEGPVQLTAACQSLDRYLFLFNDLLLIAKQRSSSMYKLKQRIRVSEIWLADCIDEIAESYRPHDRSMVIGWPTTNYVATFGSPQLMAVWREKLISLIAEEREKEEKCCMIKIRCTTPEGCHASKTLSVTNTEDACSVVGRCIEEFHIQNPATQDYRLWAISPRKDDPPYPLIGHEIPYAIRKNHEREWGQEDGGEMIDSLRGLDLSYFTLQPAKKKPRDLSLDDTKRAKKVKKSPLHGIFKKNQKSAPATPSGCLFGHNLSDICDGDKLPEQILVILRVLFQQGPYTIGVFRKPGNHKKCQDIRTKLDNGELVKMEELTVPVAASLFKDFLMSLPNSLLGSELFDQWVATASLTEEKHREQRIDLCKKYISSLPLSQQTLLRYLICVLHTIASVQTDKDQGMDAYGLAVCIGQSMLWPSTSNSSNISDMTAKVPAVVQFLIENCQHIFGADSLKVFGDLPQEVRPSQDSSTDSDSIHSLLSSLPEQPCVNTRDNSSLDSLERDCYYTEVDSSPQLAKSHLSPTNLSRDSGLTLSDTQLYDDGAETEQTSARKQPTFTRSYSQSDDQQPSADPGNLSHSQDAISLHHSGLPVPPPRKTKKRTTGPESESKLLRNSASTNVVSDYRRQSAGMVISRRVSDDSTLGSLDEEYPSEGLHRNMNLDLYRHGFDMGTLTKSDSGAHLYLSDTDMVCSHSGMQHSAYRGLQVCGRQSSQAEPSAKYCAHGDIRRLGASLDSQLPLAVASAKNQVLPNRTASIPAAMAAGTPSKDQLTPSKGATPSKNSTSTEASFSNELLPHRKQDCDNASRRPAEPVHDKSSQMQSSQGSPTVELGRNQAPASSSDKRQPPKLIRRDAVDMTAIRKGMTPSGEDKFPTQIPLRTSLYDLDADLTSVPVAQTDSKHSHSSSQSHGAGKTSGACRRSDSYSGTAPSLVKRFQQKVIEKSASDTVINEQFELSGPVRATAHVRPSNPPSYEEAVHRQSQLGSRLHLSEQDIVVQQKNSARAKQLYEESLKKYETDELHTCCPPHQSRRHSPVRGYHGNQNNLPHPQFVRQPPPYEQACHRAAQRSSRENPSRINRMEAKGSASQAEKDSFFSDTKSKDVMSQGTGSQFRDTSTGSVFYRTDLSASHAGSADASSHRADSRGSQSQSPAHHSDSPVRYVNSPVYHSNSASPEGQVKVSGESPTSCSSTRSCPGSNRSSPRQTTTDLEQSKSHGQLVPDSNPENQSKMSADGQSQTTQRNTDYKNSPVVVPEHIARQQQQHAERRKSRSRSCERRAGQRYSDPKMTSSKSTSTTNLNRSKSDSQEHVDKVNRFKVLQAYENNKENMSLEKLQGKQLLGEGRGLAEHSLGDERMKSHTEEPSQRRSVNNASVLRAAATEQHQKNEPKQPARRLSVPSSVRNRDWHKELASQYTDTFYRPESVEKRPNKVLKFGYVSQTDKVKQSSGQARPHWTPPIHPTKDLVYVTKDDMHARQSTASSPHRVKRRDSRSKSQERPISLITDDVQKLREFTEGRSDGKSAEDKHLSSGQTKSATSADDMTPNEAGIHWSVAKLRSLYVGDKLQKERANQTARANSDTNPHFYTPGSQPPMPAFRQEDRQSKSSHFSRCYSQKQKYVKEQTNPDADEAYV